MCIVFRCDFVAPNRIIEPFGNNINDSEAKGPSIATSLKVLEPPSSLLKLADYYKKMKFDLEGSVVLDSVSESNSTLSTDIHDEPVSSGKSPGILGTQIETKQTELPSSHTCLTLVSHPGEPTPLPSSGRKLDLESFAVPLPAAIVVPSKVMSELPNTQLGHEQDVAAKPEVAVTMPTSAPVPMGSVADSVSGAPVLISLEELAVCSGVVMGTSEQDQSDSCNVFAPPMEVEVEKTVELPAAPEAFLTDKDLSPNISCITNVVPVSTQSLLIEAASEKTGTVPVQKVYSARKSLKRKPGVVNTVNPLTDYFRPVLITLTTDDDNDDEEVDASGMENARIIHLSVESSDVETGTVAADALERCLHSLETAQIVPKQTDILEECLASSVACAEVETITKEEDEKCEVSVGRQVFSPLKVVVEKVEDFGLTKTFSALETTPPLNIEHKELALREVSHCSRRKNKSPLKRNAGDSKQPSFKGRSKRVRQMSERSMINRNKSLDAGIQNETPPWFKTPVVMRTNEHDACNMVKEVPGGIIEKVCESTDSHEQSGCLTSSVCSDKCVLAEVHHTPAVETSVSQLGEKRKFSSSDTGVKPSASVRKPTSKRKHSITLRESSRKEINHKSTDNANQTACNLRLDSTSGTLVVPETFKIEVDMIPVTGMKCGKRRSEAKYSDSLILARGVYLKERKMKLNETGCEDDSNTGKVSRHKLKSSHHHQNSLNALVMEDKSHSLLKEGGKNSLSQSPEILVGSTDGISVFDKTKTGEVSAVTVPVFPAIMTGSCPGEVSILATETSVIPESSNKGAEKDGESIQSCEVEAIREVISVPVHGSHREKNITLEEDISDEKVISGRRSRYSAIEGYKKRPNTGPRKLRSSTNKLDEHTKDKVSLDTVGCNLRSIPSQKKSVSLHIPDHNIHKNVNNRYQTLDHSKESDVQMSHNQILGENSVIKLDLKTSVQTEGTRSSISKMEVTLPCVHVQNSSTSPNEVHTDSWKAADSEDVIESSQDSNVSSLIACRLPLMRKCSVSICRIDTTLGPGAKVNVFDSDCKLIVHTPEKSGSSFKVYTTDEDIPASTKQEKSAKAVSGVGKAHGMTRRSAVRSLYGKCADVTEMDSVQDKPSVSLGITSSRDERAKEPAYEIRESGYTDNIQTTVNDVPQERLKKQECENSILTVARTDAVKPKSQQITDILTSNYSPIVVVDKASVSISRQQISMAKPEVNSMVIKNCSKQLINTEDGPLKPSTREWAVASKAEVISVAEDLKARFKHIGNTFKADSTGTAVITESQLEQQITTLKPENKNTTVMKDDAEKLELNSSNCEEISVICIRDNTAELQPKHTGVDKKIKNNSEIKNCTDRQGAKLVLRSSSERLLTKDEFMTDRTQQLVTPKPVSTNQCKTNSNKRTKDDKVFNVDHKISMISDKSDFIDNTSGTNKTLNGANILEGYCKAPFPLQSHNRPPFSGDASPEVPHVQVASSLDNPAAAGASKAKTSTQNAGNISLCEKSVCDWSVGIPSEVKICDGASSDNNETPSLPSSTSLICSPSSLCRVFSSLVGSPETGESPKSHHRCPRSGRACFMLDHAFALKDIETRSDVCPEETGSIHSATEPCSQLQGKKYVCRMTDGGLSPLEM
jgi:hypothetical protein